ncbi:MAG TPA: hypothetical protein VGN23_04310 [Verrucomicrobiae bacterium]|jgi:hypothetical protein
MVKPLHEDAARRLILSSNLVGGEERGEEAFKKSTLGINASLFNFLLKLEKRSKPLSLVLSPRQAQGEENK